MEDIPLEPEPEPRQKPLISIITVVFNGFQFIEGTLKSIENQNIKNFEYIIVDGASNDGTIELINEYKHIVDKFISEPDKGLYYAMNKAIDIAEGKYLWFINAGDKIYEDNTTQLIEAINKKDPEPDLIYGETIIIDSQDNIIGLRRLQPPLNLNWRHLINGLVVCHQSIIVKKNIAPKYNTKFKISADYDWILKILKNAKKIENSHLILSRYLDNGISKKNIPLALKERYKIMIKNFGFLKTTTNHIFISYRFFRYLLKNRRY